MQTTEQMADCSNEQKPALEIPTSSARLAHKPNVDFM